MSIEVRRCSNKLSIEGMGSRSVKLDLIEQQNLELELQPGGVHDTLHNVWLGMYQRHV